MSEYIVVDHNLTTNEIVEREMNAEEIAEKKQREIDAKKVADELADNTKARESATNKLAALGLTPEEIKSLIS